MGGADWGMGISLCSHSSVSLEKTREVAAHNTIRKGVKIVARQLAVSVRTRAGPKPCEISHVVRV